MKSRAIIFGLLMFVGIAMGSLMALNPEPYCVGEYIIESVPLVATAGTTFTLSGKLTTTSQCQNPKPIYKWKWLVEILPPEGVEAEARRLLYEDWSYISDDKVFNLGTGPDWEGWTIVANSSVKCEAPLCYFQDEAPTATWVVQAP